MIREIYLRDANDPYYEAGVFDYINDVENLVTQLRVLLGTKKGEVLGEYGFGTDIRYLVFNTVKNSSKIESEISELISKYVYVRDGLDVSVKMNFGKDNKERPYGVVDVYINGVKTIGFLVDNEE